ncbi:MarR family winged helix-turn-helix transcriptional regulator [Pseudochelatococcus contaminans]|uniref:DNA-binding MarR family transcriptional regulator n=1 Tax=Pseudochelatococcus contaminans TaxID=1538103 RepID=A0A7W6EID9_9HYPH|nr:MarR family transcriptional regulator [Pseudochelatococcus contaminans]MBB3811054.1 DNA-binding MarR family transcriptional regulator [Pseudochelatococcus contaminans]
MANNSLKETIPPTGEPRGEEAARLDVAHRAFFRLYQCANLMHKVGARFIEDFNSTTQQWAVLGALARPNPKQRGMTVKELIAFLLVSRQNLTPVLDRLEKRGWIERVKDAEDARSRRVALTPAGDAVWTEMEMAISVFYAEALDDFSLDEEVTLYRLLDKLKSRLNEL